MDLLAEYSNEQEGGDGDSPPASPDLASAPGSALGIKVSAAPEVDTTGLVLYGDQAVAASSIRRLQDPTARKVMYNLPIEDMHAPLLGPAHPFNKDGLAAGMRNHRAGHVEDTHLHSFAFDEQYNTYHSYGRAAAPSGDGYVGTSEQDADGTTYSAPKRRKTTAERKADAARREELAAQVGVLPEGPFQLKERQPWAAKTAVATELTEEQKEFMAKVEADKLEASANTVETKGPTSFFHGKEGKEGKDYQGRSWMLPPKDKRKENDYCFLPKRWIHTWSGHTKGVNAIKFFPGQGHLLLSAGLDGKVKIWDVFGGGKCMRTYLGHSKGVRDVQFSNDGKRFISTGYDKNVRVWDTETGQVLRTFNTGKMYYVAKLHPDDDKQNVLMAGCADKKIYQWDLDTGDLVQEYNYHLGAVNTITFVDEGRRFVTSSDDKTLRVWEFGIPVQIKYIADPSMHSIPYISLHPKNTYMIGQSLDNQIVSYSIKDRFRQNRKKTFKGHNTAGYACGVNYSPDGRFVMSGDAEGRCFFWEWQQPHKIVRTIKAHEGVCIDNAWHPLESSKVATCGWDGLIKYWD